MEEKRVFSIYIRPDGNVRTEVHKGLCDEEGKELLEKILLSFICKKGEWTDTEPNEEKGAKA